MNNTIKNSIFQGHFGRPGNVPSPADPITITTMLMEVGRIYFYEHNPRRIPNSRYDEIKESIRQQGLDNPLPISRRPGDSHYIIYKGGNTRLKILKELWEETRNERFQHVRCEFHPFESDTEALIAHLRENDLRGDMVFIDRALAVQSLKTQLETETGETLSLRKLADVLKQHGLPVSLSLLSPMEYAISLHVLIPSILAAGLGRPPIEKLRKLEKAAQVVWKHHKQADMPEVLFHDQVFAKALATTDTLGDSWTYETAEKVVCNNLAETISLPTETVRTELAQVLDGKTLKAAQILPVILADNLRSPPVAAYAEPEPDTNTITQDWDGTDDREQVYDHYPPQPTSHQETTVTAGQWLVRLKELREQNWQHARLLAGYVKNGASSLVQLDIGYGFLVVDVFDHEWVVAQATRMKTAQDPAERQDGMQAFGHASALWWFLAQHSASFDDSAGYPSGCPAHIRAEYLPEESFIDDIGQRALFHPNLDPMNTPSLFWHYLPDNHFDKAVAIIRNTRLISDLITKQTHGANIWEIKTT